MIHASNIGEPGGPVTDQRVCNDHISIGGFRHVYAAGTTSWKEVDDAVYAILGQAVRKEAYGTSRQHPVLVAIENFILGDARD